MHKKLRVLASLGGAAIGLALMAATPALAGNITSPTANPYTVPVNSSGAPVAFTVSASGFPAGTAVSVEQCDGTPATEAGWTPAEHCDSGTSRAAVVADASGNVTFPSTSNNYKFIPVKGTSPQNKFTCGSASDIDPQDGLPFSRACQVRVSSNNTAVTADQVFFTITFPDAETPPPSTPEAPFALLLPLGGAAAAGGYFFLRNRRASSSVAA